MGWGPKAWGQGRGKQEDGKAPPCAHTGLQGQSCCLPTGPGALCPYLPGNQQAPRPAAWVSLASCFFCGFLKLPVETAKAKGSTCLSQAKLTCPSILLNSQKFLPWPCRGQRKWETAYMLSPPPPQAQASWTMAVRPETQTLGTLRIVVWLPVEAEDGAWPPHLSWAEERLGPLGASQIALVSWTWHHVWQPPSWQNCRQRRKRSLGYGREENAQRPPF